MLYRSQLLLTNLTLTLTAQVRKVGELYENLHRTQVTMKETESSG